MSVIQCPCGRRTSVTPGVSRGRCEVRALGRGSSKSGDSDGACVCEAEDEHVGASRE